MTDINTSELIEQLKKYDDAYFNDESIVSDSDYDRLKRVAFNSDPADPYFTQVGSDVRGGKINLPYPLGSLDQVYENEIEKWVSKYDLRNEDVIESDKLDGASVLLIFRNGQFTIAYSRGNGHEGADWTRHIKNIPSVPQSLAGVNYLAVRAEVIIKNSVFDEFFSSKYKNARNFVSGCMNRSVTEQSTLDKIDVVAYQIVETDYQDIDTKTDELELLSNLGFLTVKYSSTVGSKLTDVYLEKKLVTAKVESEYELDGLVLTINKYKNIQSHRTSASINPEHSIKYKVLDAASVVETIVTNVLWEISKNGYLKPRIEIIPVELFGTTVTYCSGFNARYIVDNGIGKGARINVTKSGMVIPFCVNVISRATPTLPDSAVFGPYDWNENGVEFVVNDPDSNPIVIFKRVLDFFETLNVDQLRESSLSKAINKFNLSNSAYDDIILTLSDLTEREWIGAVGANGEKIYASLHRRYQNMKYETLLGAIAHMGTGFGTRKAKMFLDGVRNAPVYDLDDFTVDDIIKIDGFDVKTAQMVVAGLPKAKALIESLQPYLTFITETKTSELAGLNVVMTGFRDPDLHANIEKMGGKIGNSVSKKTTHLLALDISGNSGKLKKARDLGVKVMMPDDFKTEYNL